MVNENNSMISTGGVEALEGRRLLSISIEIVEAPISAAAISDAPELASYRSFDLRATLTLGDHFNIAGMDAVLENGAQFYQHPLVGNVSHPALWPIFPATEFDTFVQSPNGFPTNVLYPGTFGEPPFQPSKVSVDWAPGPGIRTGSGTFTIARLTIPDGARGYVFARGISFNSPISTAMNTFAVAALPNPSSSSAWIGGYTVNQESVSPLPNGETGAYLDLNKNGQRDAGDANPITGLRVYSLTQNLRRGQSAWGFVVPSGSHALNMIPSTTAGVAHDSLSENVEVGPNDYAFRNKFRVPDNSAGLYARAWTILPSARQSNSTVEFNSLTAFVDLDDDSTLDAGEPFVGSSSSFSGQRVVSGISPGTHRVRFVSTVQGYVPAPSYPSSQLVEFEAGKVARIEFFFVPQALLRSSSLSRLPTVEPLIFSQNLLDAGSPPLEFEDEIPHRPR